METFKLNWNKIETLVCKHSLLIIFTIYTLCNIFFLTNNFLFWDDWCITGNSFKDLFEIYKGPGTCPWGILFMEIIFHIPPFIARWIVFGLYFATAVCIEEILKFLGVKDNSRFIIVLLYAINPIVIAKYALIDAGYYFGQSLFFFASYLVICHNENKKAFYSALILFFLSYMTSSLLCFYVAPMGILFYKEVVLGWKGFKNSLLGFIKKYWLFILIPFIFFTFKRLCLKPTGFYAEEKYNSINIPFLIKNIYNSFFKSITDIINWMFYSNFQEKSIKRLIFCVLVLSLVIDKKSFWSFTISLILFLFARLPYVAVGKMGFIGNAIEVRHFMLTPLPFTLILYLFVICIIRNTGKIINFIFFKNTIKENNEAYKGEITFELRYGWKIIIFSLIFFNLCVINLKIGKHVFEDTFIYESIIEHCKESDEIRNNETFSVTANTLSYGAFLKATFFTDYRMFGLFWRAFGNEKHFSYNTQYETPEKLDWYYENRNYSSVKWFKIRDITNAPISYHINIQATNNLLSRRRFLKTYFLYIFNRKSYYDYIKDYVQMDILKIN